MSAEEFTWAFGHRFYHLARCALAIVGAVVLLSGAVLAFGRKKQASAAA